MNAHNPNTPSGERARGVQDKPDRLTDAVGNSVNLQVSRLVSRFALPEPTAVVAELAFGEVAQ
jgi:hypothetical protein